MTVADDLESARAALEMINPAPYNAEAPPQALVGDITPTELHYVRSNFALPTHDGTLEIGGAVGNPTTLTLDDLRALPAHDQAVTLECAGNGRLDMRPLPTGEPWGDYAVSTARWTGALLSDVLALAQPASRGGRRPVRRCRSRPVPPAGDPPGDQPERPHLRPRVAPRRGRRSVLGDPGRLRDERRTAEARSRRTVPAHRAALVCRRLGEVAEADRRPHRALHRRVPDRPLHLPVAGSPPRGRAPDARARPHHRPRSRRDPPLGPTRSAGRPGPAPGPSRRSTSASPAKATGTQRSWTRRRVPTSGRTGRSSGTAATSDATPCAPGRPTPPATSSPTSHRGTGWATGTTPSRSSSSTGTDRSIVLECAIGVASALYPVIK